MAVKYRLIERKNLGNDKTETPKKQYAQVVFSPGKALRIAKKLTNFEKKELSEPQSGGSQDSESPDEI